MPNVLLLIALIVLSSQLSSAQPAWLKQSMPTPGDTTSLMDVDFMDANTGIAVGLFGTIIGTTDAGKTWLPLNSSNNDHWYSVSFTNANNATAVGRNSSLSRTTDGGMNWVNQSPEAQCHLYAVSFADSLHGIAVGGDSDANSHKGFIVHTSNAGVLWTPITEWNWPFFLGIAMLDAEHAIAVSENQLIMTTEDGGATWTPRHSGSGELSDVTYTDSNTAIAVGYSWSLGEEIIYGIILRSADAGVHWDTIATVPNRSFNAVSFSNANHGTIVGDSGDIRSTIDGGLTWTEETSTTTKSLLGVDMTGPSNGSSVGPEGTILRKSESTTSVKLFYDHAAPFRSFPNPANDVVTLQFGVPRQGAVLLDIVNFYGNVVAVISNEVMKAGTYETTYDVSGISSGAYYYRMHANGVQSVTPFVVSR